MQQSKTKILFVCLGNICRSPLAETIMNDLLEKRGLQDFYSVDSAGIIDYHEGERADYRMRCHASFRGYDITHLSRPVQKSDFEIFDLIIGMDNQNVRDLQSLAETEQQRDKIQKMTIYCPEFNRDTVPDPYYGGDAGFELVINMLEKACANMIDALEQKREKE
ncbi:MAG: low molecular weight phosphotyrosine protein phosphatase [Bacteroidales bacterium]|nr:low molecular weight phosphotyrosine protein phosphatase [Bacteroidales bacterium]